MDDSQTLSQTLPDSERLGQLQAQNQALRSDLAAIKMQYDELYHFAPIGYFTLTDDGTITDMNRAAARILNLDREKLIQKPFLTLVHDSDREAFILFQRQLFTDNRQISREIQLVSPNGNTGMTAALYGVALDAYTCRIAMHDITRRREAEDALNLERDIQAYLMGTHIAAVTLLDHYGNVTYMNERAEQISGLPKTQLYGHSHRAWLHNLRNSDGSPPTDDELPFHRILYTRQPLTKTPYCIEAHGRLTPILMTGAPFYDRDGKIDRVLFLIEDVTDEHQRETRLQSVTLQEAELKRLRTRFVHTVSHQFRTPLASILLSSELIRHYGDRITRTKRDEHLTEIQTQVRQMMHLIDNAVTLSQFQAFGMTYNPRPINVESLCSGIVAEIQDTVRLTHHLYLHMEGACQWLTLDEDLVRLMLTMLLQNAVTYSISGTPVDIRVICTDEQVLIEVTDSGIGIDEDDKPYVFDVFYRGKNAALIPGAGLGLALVKGAVEAHQGNITMTSAAGQGTTFLIQLPIAQTLA